MVHRIELSSHGIGHWDWPWPLPMAIVIGHVIVNLCHCQSVTIIVVQNVVSVCVCGLWTVVDCGGLGVGRVLLVHSRQTQTSANSFALLSLSLRAIVAICRDSQAQQDHSDRS